MPIMSDKWIKFKAENDQLIVPFHAESRSSLNPFEFRAGLKPMFELDAVKTSAS